MIATMAAAVVGKGCGSGAPTVERKNREGERENEGDERGKEKSVVNFILFSKTCNILTKLN